MNKLCGSLDEAMKRARSIAPMNCRRNGHGTPCTETGIYEEYNIPGRRTAVIDLSYIGYKDVQSVRCWNQLT